MSCRLCKRESEPGSVLCQYHGAAKKNIESAFEQWKTAYGALGWKEYLERIKQNLETGQWAKEVAELLYSESAE